MLLGFKTQINRQPTYFPEKILSGDKIHTFRNGNRWKSGNSIQMATGVRTKKYHQFNGNMPKLEKCVSVQKIEIKWFESASIDTELYEYGRSGKVVVVFIEGKSIHFTKIELLAKNDGFDNLETFFNFFNTDFDGQIIHWTDLKY